MDDNGHRENGRHKPQQSQWLMQHQPSMKQIMTIMAERDAAIQERNLAISEKKAALAERDMAILQRDSAIAERNNAMLERENAIATLQYRESAINAGSNISPCPPGCQIPRGLKHMHHPHHPPAPPHMVESPYNPPKDIQIPDTVPMSPVPPEPAKNRRAKCQREAKPGKKTTLRQSKKVKREAEEQLGRTKPDWKDQGLGLNQVVYDETTMPVPVCSCTGVLRPCYKWGNGGWQSACCTNSLSMYPLPAVPNKRHARVGGRKMSGSAFSKLLSRLAAEGNDLSNPVDLKLHWAKHGTNRYITIK